MARACLGKLAQPGRGQRGKCAPRRWRPNSELGGLRPSPIRAAHAAGCAENMGRRPRANTGALGAVMGGGVPGTAGLRQEVNQRRAMPLMHKELREEAALAVIVNGVRHLMDAWS